MGKLFVIIVAAAIASTSPSFAGQTDAPERAADAADKVICKRFPETGSLVRVNRVCKVKRDWERERDALRAGGSVADSCRNRGEPNPNVANGGGVRAQLTVIDHTPYHISGTGNPTAA